MSQGGSALDAFVQKRETIAADLHRLEKQVGDAQVTCLGLQNATRGGQGRPGTTRGGQG